ncbi:hypothetical protein KDA23_01960 [Candidatus Saccharibacteria bacterium]|nr:hypothetical protein [Candidatus Saccharibacteria bacterium]
MTNHNYEPTTEPIHVANKNKRKFSRREKIIAGIGAGVSLLAIGGGVALGGSNEEAKDTRPVATADAVPGQEGVAQDVDYSKVDVKTLTVDEFYNDAIYPQEYRIKWANEIIKERQDAAYAELNSTLVNSGFQPLGPLVEPSVNNTGDEILVQQAVIDYIASTAPTVDEGKKLMAAVADESLSTFDEALENIGDKKVISPHRVLVAAKTSKPIESPVFSQVAVGDYKPNGVPSKIMSVNNEISGEASQITVRFVGGRYITHSTIRDGDPNWITYPEQLSDK